MPKKDKEMLTEGAMDKIIAAIFSAIGKGRPTPTMKQLMKDPEYRKLHQELEKGREELKQVLDRIEKRRKVDTPSIDRALGIKR